jgi:hypothetical protein
MPVYVLDRLINRPVLVVDRSISNIEGGSPVEIATIRLEDWPSDVLSDRSLSEISEFALPPGLSISALTRISEQRFDDFIGPHMVGSIFGLDGRTDSSFEALWLYAADVNCHVKNAPARDGYTTVRLEDYEPSPTLVLLSPDAAPCGFYSDGMIYIDPGHRGRRLSTDLILRATGLANCTPFENKGGLGFSAEGIAAHRRAYTHLLAVAVNAGIPVAAEKLREFEIPTGERPVAKLNY